MTKLAFIVPCYNEQEVLPDTTTKLLDVLRRLRQSGKISEGRILYVDDGSGDRTWTLIERYASQWPEVGGIKLAHNEGHQRALWAGLEHAVVWADALVSIDADLQDDVEVIGEMLDRYQEGKDIVFGVRNARETDTLFKRITALGFYKAMSELGTEIVYNHADFRLMSQRATSALLSYPERNLFLRGMVCTLGFSTAYVYYDRKPRLKGESKYPVGKMLSLAMEGITSFSVRPLRFISWLGSFCIVVALVAIVYGICSYASGHAIEGWASLMISMWFMGGSILLACGIIGEYLGKIYTEVKRRPRYFVEQEVGQAFSKEPGIR